MGMNTKYRRWIPVHSPVKETDRVPKERKVVAVWVKDLNAPFCGYLRYAARGKKRPYFVVYFGKREITAEVESWCNCMPVYAPDGDKI